MMASDSTYHVGKGRLGLVSMRERAEEVGGTFEIESEPGGGTRIVVHVPLSPAQQKEAIV